MKVTRFTSQRGSAHLGRGPAGLVLLVLLLVFPACDSGSGGGSGGGSQATQLEVLAVEPSVGGYAGGAPVLIEASFPEGFHARDVAVRFGSWEALEVTKASILRPAGILAGQRMRKGTW